MSLELDIDSETDLSALAADGNTLDLPDDIALTTSGGLVADGSAGPEKGDRQIGIDEDGNGYLRIVEFGGQVFRFSVPRAEVEAFAAKQERDHPSPRKPQGFDNKLGSATGWEGGEAVHTGGNIWCRIWRRDLGDGFSVEVAYGVPHCDGASAGLIDSEDGAWYGEIDSKTVDEHTDEACHTAAKDLMRGVDLGEYDETISERKASAPA